MNNQHSDEPPDDPEEDWEEPPSADEECQLNGHTFEGYDTISEICSVCGKIREYASNEHPSREITTAGEMHVCWSAGDHAFGLNGACVYCGKAEAGLTKEEHEQHAAARRARRGE